jgi:NAD+ kinase
MFQKTAIHARRNLEESADFCGILKKLKSCSKEIFVTENARAHADEEYPSVDFSEKYDIFVVVGGDGSVLNVARRMEDFSTPLLPISAGTLGFLAEIPPKEFSDVCERIFKKQFSIDKRTLLDVTLIDPKGKKPTFDVSMTRSYHNLLWYDLHL